MTPQKFDRYMVVVGAGAHAKFAQFSDGERCAHFLGVLSLAARAPLRGYLLVGDEEAGPKEVAREAAVTVRQASGALDKLKRKGVLIHDEEVGAWRVHDWHDVNPDPRKDDTNADRQRRFRERRVTARNGASNTGSNAPVTHDVTQTEGARSALPPSTSSSVVPSTENDKGGSSSARRKRVDQTETPDDLSAELLAKLPAVLAILVATWDVRGGIEPQERGVGLGMLRNPRADHVSVARKVQQWLLAGRGQNASCSDIAKRFGDWCADEPASKPQSAGSGVSELDQRRLAAVERLRTERGAA